MTTALRSSLRFIVLASLLAVAARAQAQTILTPEGGFRLDAPDPYAVARIGSTDKDLTFTPVTPCRIADTRVAGGPISANSSRSFLAVAANVGANFTSQGGSATNCGVADVDGSAVAINVTAVTPAGGGFATVFPAGTSRPLAASVNYTAGSIVNNTVVVAIPNPLGITDFTIYTFAASDYVVDIVGYYSRPEATPQSCIGTTVTTVAVPATSNNFYFAAACPAGYQATTPYCWGQNNANIFVTGSGLDSNNPTGLAFCAFQNSNGTASTASVGALCCRVPGK